MAICYFAITFVLFYAVFLLSPCTSAHRSFVGLNDFAITFVLFYAHVYTPEPPLLKGFFRLEFLFYTLFQLLVLARL